MKTDIFENIELIKNLPTTIRLCSQKKPINLYFSDAAKLTCHHIALKSEEHDHLIQAIKTLTLIDNQHVNHLFIQFFCLAHEPSGALKCVHSTLCFDSKSQSIYLSPSSLNFFQDHELINFASREKQGFSKTETVKFHYLSAEDFPDLDIAHSEHLFLKYLAKQENLILDFLNDHGIDSNWQIQKIGINLYSSLDSCDKCQNKLLTFFHPDSPFSMQVKTDLSHAGYGFSNDLSWQLIFFSTVPCKKSSYVVSQNNAYTPFRYNKDKKTFAFTHAPEQQCAFPCQIHDLEIKKLSNPLMLSQIIDF